MEIKQLEIFACVAKRLSFSKAAEQLYISQPNVSASISSLERSLGVQLLIRSTKEVSLTKAGRDFLVYAQKIMSLHDQAITDVGGENRIAAGAIDIIASTIPAQYLLPEIIAAFQKQWPNVTFRVEQTDSLGVEKAMCGFQYDFGLSGSSSNDDRFIYYPVYDDELVLAVPGGSPDDAGAICGDFADYISKTPFIMRESGSGTRAEIELRLSKLGVDPKKLHIPAYFPDANSILLAVARGMGVSLISKVACAMHEKAGLIRSIEMGGSLFRRKIFLLHNKELWLTPLQRAFTGHICQFYSG